MPDTENQQAPGKQTATAKATGASTQPGGGKDKAPAAAEDGPGKQTLVESIQHAEQRLQRPGYQYLTPFARPVIAQARKPGADPGLAAKLDHLFEVSKRGGDGELKDAKAASNAYHAKLGEQAIAELTGKAPAGSPQARAVLEPAAKSLEAKYAPLLEDDVHLMIHLGQIQAKQGGKTPAVSIEVSIRPNDWGCIGWLSWETVAGAWRWLTGAQPPQQQPTERSPLLGDQQQQLAQQPKPAQPMVATSGDAAKQDTPPKPTVATANSEAQASGGEPSGSQPAPEAKKEEKPTPAEATDFAAKYKAKGVPTPHAVGTPKTSPHPVKEATEGGKKQPGYVINMATIPSEVQPHMAARYFEGERAQAADRTAVVVGVNTFLGMDSGKDGDKQANVIKGINSVEKPDGQMAVFGYTWAPGWQKDGGDVSLSTVREDWRKLPADAQAPASKLMDDLVKDTLPYGFFRNQVLSSEHTKQAVADVGKHADPVHIVVQDADGDVKSVGGDHVLTAYDKVLAEMKVHPLLTIGGYHFGGHDWPANSDARTKRLTELSNEVDRAVRTAIAKVYPEMLYPTEPNMLIKATDAKHKDGVFDRHLEDNLFGTGASEGRTARQNIMRGENKQPEDKRNPNPVTWEPSTSTTTSPVPERPERGLTVPATPEHIESASSGELYRERTKATKISADKQHASVAIEEQSQNMLAPRRLAYEFSEAWQQHDPAAATPGANNPHAISSSNQRKIKTAFEPPSVEVKNRTTPPKQEEPAPVVAEASSSSSGKKGKEPKKPKAPPVPDPVVLKAQEVSREIVAAMSEPEMIRVWAELTKILTDLQKEGEAKKQKAQVQTEGGNV